MTGPAGTPRLRSLVVLEHSRRLLAETRTRWVAVGVALAYALLAMWVGAMLVVSTSTFQVESYVAVIPRGTPWWNYPAILVETPSFVLALPFFATVEMVVVSAGVGLGMTVAGLLIADLLRRRRLESGNLAGVSLSGFSPAMVALVTLGACCSTTAAASAGVVVVAAVTGTTVAAALANAWYLGLFQLAVLWVGLFAQEQLLVIYRGLYPPDPRTAVSPARRGVARSPVVGVVRALLLVGGTTWALSVFAAWAAVSPAHAGPLEWADWLLLHELLGWFAVLVALRPGVLVTVLHGRTLERGIAAPVRLVLGAAGALLLGCIPSPLANSGLIGWLNEVLGAAGLPSSWGAVAPPAVGTLGLAFRWALQFGGLGAFALAVALRPGAVARWFQPEVRGSGGPEGSAPAASHPIEPGLSTRGGRQDPPVEGKPT